MAQKRTKKADIWIKSEVGGIKVKMARKTNQENKDKYGKRVKCLGFNLGLMIREEEVGRVSDFPA